ncbi:hypothetical protein DFH08DRAFT_784947 [Mycena albidolilacea]|uniref:Golgi apparatus membrane protein TVP38 n=1 Tax=Mycena albidolilacea TaxID=1033008 RepID=A0AAD7EKQ8_9AGAR|nr:hypothetical protein DFH08DRAFT_784947 [Mycena albidolilacea]
MSQPSGTHSNIVAMPQPTYAYDKPPQLPGATYYPPEPRRGAAGTKAPELIARDISRTPSPTPSEVDLLNGVKKKLDWKARIRLYLILAVVIAIIVLIEAFHVKIINALKPATQWLHDTKGGWLIPILIFIVLSFPPLFGHELVAMLCGVAWGLGAGFGIVAAGTLLGEICTFFFFKYCCGARGKRLELTNMGYGTLAHVVREGGLLIAIIVRYSSLPAHLTTAVFATCGMQFWVFLVAAVVSLPKQIVLVYVGVALASNDSRSDKIQRIVIGVTVVITVIGMVYIRRLMKAAQPAVVYARRKARQAKLQRMSEV